MKKDKQKNPETLNKDEIIEEKVEQNTMEDYFTKYYNAYKNDYISQYYQAYKDLKAKETPDTKE